MPRLLLLYLSYYKKQMQFFNTMCMSLSPVTRAEGSTLENGDVVNSINKFKLLYGLD